jgi:hypothetical protein
MVMYLEDALPDYLHDLNAMHEMEKMLPFDRRRFYCEMLVKVIGSLTPQLEWEMIHATAAQRREAFLRTFGKWKE